jgi:hypothetical protein
MISLLMSFYRLNDKVIKKIKTPMSEFVREYCALPVRNRKKEATDNNQFFQIGVETVAEKNCKKLEDFFKLKK